MPLSRWVLTPTENELHWACGLDDNANRSHWHPHVGRSTSENTNGHIGVLSLGNPIGDIFHGEALVKFMQSPRQVATRRGKKVSDVVAQREGTKAGSDDAAAESSEANE